MGIDPGGAWTFPGVEWVNKVSVSQPVAKKGAVDCLSFPLLLKEEEAAELSSLGATFQGAVTEP